MTKVLQRFTILIAMVLSLGHVTFGQTPGAEKLPVKIQIVISRFDGDRKVSSLPFTLLAVANGQQASLLTGANVPIVLTTPSSDGKQAGTISYTNVGTTIQATVTTEAGRFQMQLLIDDKSVIDVKPPSGNAISKANEPASFRDLSYNAIIILKDGETKQFVSAPDKSNGEMVKIDVTLTLDK